MQAGIYIELNILSSLICILLFYQQKHHKVFDFLGTTAFNSILWTAVLILLSDTVSWLIISDILPWNDTTLVVMQSLYYALQALLPMFFFGYCLEVSGYPATGIWKILMYVPVVLTVFLLIVNYDSGMVFYVLDGRIRRGSGFLLATVAPMIYIINSLSLCIFFYFSARKHKQTLRKSIAFHMVICILMSLAAAVCGAFITSVNPWHVFTTSLVYLYVQLHSYQEHELDVKATTDSLTGLKNHAAYSIIKERMDKRIAEEPDIRFAVAVMDVNDLKHTNDRYGHEAGDALIIRASQLICKVCEHSPVCRIGGDEFVAIMENGDYENREALRGEFARQLAECTFSVGGQELPVSAAFGIAEYQPEVHKVFENVFHDADEAMYRDKAFIKGLKRS